MNKLNAACDANSFHFGCFYFGWDFHFGCTTFASWNRSTIGEPLTAALHMVNLVNALTFKIFIISTIFPDVAANEDSSPSNGCIRRVAACDLNALFFSLEMSRSTFFVLDSDLLLCTIQSAKVPLDIYKLQEKNIFIHEAFTNGTHRNCWCHSIRYFFFRSCRRFLFVWFFCVVSSWQAKVDSF